MQPINTIEKIEKEVSKLSQNDQLVMLERIAHQLRRANLSEKKEMDWNELYGLGKDVWKGEDAQDFVNQLRKERL
ncbi:MAG: hypothetical protein KGZ58_09895 [Ignavibacteriales bacterium]|nr:hypothetical protein [Ignavibacteriales bacterium]